MSYVNLLIKMAGGVEVSALSHYIRNHEATLPSLLNCEEILEIVFGRATYLSLMPSLLSD